MTDEHGPDSEPVHDDVSHEEHAPVAESAEPIETAGTWSDDHPPADDFSDAGAAHEEAATVSEEATEEEAAAATPPPSRSMLPLFAGIGGILLIGAVIYWQFGHSSPPPVMTAQTQTPKSSASFPPSAKLAPIPPSGSGKVEESDISALYKTPSEPPAPAIPAPSSETASTTSLSPPPAATPAAAPPVPPASPLSPAASAPLPPPLAAPAADPRIDTLMTSMNALQKSVETTTQEVNKLNTMVATNQVIPPPAAQISPALEDRLNKIEQGLLQIEHNETAKPAPPIASSRETEATSEIVTRSVSHHKKPVKHKPAHKKTVHHTIPPAPSGLAEQPLEPPVRATSSWVLRAATPTEAWVAYDSRTTELKHIQVGDSLPGVGTIRTIRQTPGGWEVEGSTGIIR